jgi:hypothetical protein
MPTENISGAVFSLSDTYPTSISTGIILDGTAHARSDRAGYLAFGIDTVGLRSTVKAACSIYSQLQVTPLPTELLSSTVRSISTANASTEGDRQLRSTSRSSGKSAMYTIGNHPVVCGLIKQASSLTINNDPTGWYRPFDTPVIDPMWNFSRFNKALMPDYYASVSQRWVVHVDLTWVCDHIVWPVDPSLLIIKAVTTFSSQLVIRTLSNENTNDSNTKTQSLIALIDFDSMPDPTEELFIDVQYTGDGIVHLDKESSSLSFYSL